MSTSEHATEAAIRPDPVVTMDSAFFWEAADQGKLVGQRCTACGKLRHPPRPMCPFCRGLGWEAAPLSGHGTVYSWIIPRHPHPVGFTESPVVALIDLAEGYRIVSNVFEVTPAELGPGLPVEVFFAPTAGGHKVPVFRPHRAAGER